MLRRVRPRRDHVIASSSCHRSGVRMSGTEIRPQAWCVSHGARGRTPSGTGLRMLKTRTQGGIAACDRSSPKPSGADVGDGNTRSLRFSQPRAQTQGRDRVLRSARAPKPACSDSGMEIRLQDLVRFSRRARTRALPWLSPRVSHHILGPVEAGLFF